MMATNSSLLADRLDKHDVRMTNIEKRIGSHDKDSAARQEREKHFDKRFDRLEKSIGEVKGYLLKIAFFIVLSVIGSVLTFIVKGGLSL